MGLFGDILEYRWSNELLLHVHVGFARFGVGQVCHTATFENRQPHTVELALRRDRCECGAYAGQLRAYPVSS
jgi:hypothetical protein